MSSMIKKKGALSFKPKAPVRRVPGASQSRTTSARPSIEPSLEAASATRPAEPVPGSTAVLSQTLIEESEQQDIQITAATQHDLEIHPTPSSHAAVVTHVAAISTDTNPTIKAIRTTPETSGAQEEQAIQRSDQPVTTVPTLSDESPQVDHRERMTEASSEVEHRMYLDDVTATSDVIDSVYPPLPESESTSTIQGTDLSTIGTGQLHRIPHIVPGADLSALGAGQSNQGTQLVPVAPLNPDGTSGDPISQGQKPKKQPSLKRRRIEDKESDIRPTIEVQIHKPRHRPIKEPRPPRNPDDPPRKRKQRAKTPDDAAGQTIDQKTLKMSDLCKDLKQGKPFSKAEEIRKRENERRAKRKFAKMYPELNQNQGGGESTPAPEPDTLAASGPQMRIVDGQIVIDDASLVVDRHREAAAAASEMEEVVEDEFSKVITSGTHMKRETNLYWTNMETEKFYDGIRMFGTDFEMISKMFPGRNRRQVKLKFNKEEREYPKKINSALLGERVAINFEEYQSHTGLQYEEVSTIQEEQDAIEEQHESERRRIEEAAAETTRQKKADIQNQASIAPRSGGGAESAKENEPEGAATHSEAGRAMSSKNKKKAPTKRKKRNLHSTRGGGEEVEVLGRIDSVQP